MRVFVSTILLLLAGTAVAQTAVPEGEEPLPRPSVAPSRELAAQPLSGVWVPGDLLQALQTESPREIPCYLVIEAEEALEVLEECGDGRMRWTGAVLEAERAGRLEVRAGEQRRLVFRAGTPNELELVRPAAMPGEAPQLERLYRLPAALEERLRSWATAQQILVGAWKTEDGADVGFAPDGTFHIAQEKGRYRLRPGAPMPGAWGVLYLQPAEGEEERIYLLTGAGRRIGLALPPAHLVPALREAVHGGAPAAQEQEQGMQPGAAQERGMLPGEAAGGAGGSGGAGGEVEVEPAPLEITIWLTRAGPGVEQQATAPSAPAEAPQEPEMPREPPPIAQPIEPQKRCGCTAGEGVSGLGLLAIAGLALQNRRRHHPRA